MNDPVDIVDQLTLVIRHQNALIREQNRRIAELEAKLLKRSPPPSSVASTAIQSEPSDFTTLEDAYMGERQEQKPNIEPIKYKGDGVTAPNGDGVPSNLLTRAAKKALFRDNHVRIYADPHAWDD